MDSRDRSQDAAGRLVRILRRLTRIVQVVPFAYLLIVSVILLCESAMPEWAVRIADNLVGIPVGLIAGMLGIGRVLKLCRWFRTACIIPVSMKVESYVDAFVFPFSQTEVVAANTALAILFLIYIYLAFHHFFHGAQGKSLRDRRIHQIQD